MKKLLVRLLVPLMVMFAVSAVVAQPALAAPATCVTNGHVYETGGDDNFVKYETDPINGDYFGILVNVPNTGTYRVDVTIGGNGLYPGSRPRWDVYGGNGGFIGYLDGHETSGNCVSNEITYPIYGSANHYYEVKANYRTGNTNLNIQGQNHFVVIFY